MICFKSHEETRKSGEVINASWSNYGSLHFRLKENQNTKPHRHVSLLPEEMEAILAHGNYEGKWGVRPGVIAIKGRVYSRQEGDIITITEESEMIFGGGWMSLHKDEWQQLYDTILANQERQIKEWTGSK